MCTRQGGNAMARALCRFGWQQRDLGPVLVAVLVFFLAIVLFIGLTVAILWCKVGPLSGSGQSGAGMCRSTSGQVAYVSGCSGWEGVGRIRMLFPSNITLFFPTDQLPTIPSLLWIWVCPSLLSFLFAPPPPQKNPYSTRYGQLVPTTSPTVCVVLGCVYACNCVF